MTLAFLSDNPKVQAALKEHAELQSATREYELDVSLRLDPPTDE